MDERVRTVAAIFPYLVWKEILMLDRTLRVVRTGTSWSSSKLLDTEEGPDGNLRRPDR